MNSWLHTLDSESAVLAHYVPPTPLRRLVQSFVKSGLSAVSGEDAIKCVIPLGGSQRGKLEVKCATVIVLCSFVNLLARKRSGPCCNLLLKTVVLFGREFSFGSEVLLLASVVGTCIILPSFTR